MKESIIPAKYVLMLLITSIFASILIWQLLISDISKSLAPLNEVIFGYVLFAILSFFILKISRFYNLNWSYLLGNVNLNQKNLKQLYIVFPLVTISVGSIYLQYYILAFINPELITKIETIFSSNSFYITGEYYLLANILEFVLIVFIGPTVEEIFFRGLLFTSLTRKMSIKKSILITSIIFSVFHIDLLGGILFGMVLSIIYINSKSLVIPIILHIGNNFIGYIIILYRTVSGNLQMYNVNNLYKDWWLAVLSLLFSIIWLIYFYNKTVSRTKMIIPYFNDEYNHISN